MSTTMDELVKQNLISMMENGTQEPWVKIRTFLFNLPQEEKSPVFRKIGDNLTEYKPGEYKALCDSLWSEKPNEREKQFAKDFINGCVNYLKLS